ncbi:MAG: anaerobic sulfatase maturase, partial [Alphaproteobacteria bacterium]|nr:anaerobic sulfatase maturase [Alphaproteobacteria bacterium]
MSDLAATAVNIVAKPIGPLCNLSCDYCFYLEKTDMYPDRADFRMHDGLLETYVRRQIEAQPGPEIHFMWQGGEPTLMGLDFFQRAVALQQRHLPPGRRIVNALQTNGLSFSDDWGRFLHEHGFLVGLSLDGPAHLHDAYRQDH